MSDVLPLLITIEGRDYQRTGKTGTHLNTGQQAAEYACTYQHERIGTCESRAWRLADGTIEMDD
ncbi:hypothetical protein U5801_26700 [Lamprobacter modestohalophilus]|uniref:hypothetical protein n=1 Tax=Lamprobacter modestohalophilus TaxID=1064514 RepID=UPI002ADEF068|nr:hypothetical protein [Lamprobacter modestohalophilus]MEA1052338.1 hypothetical protein [Lamprobacter modestohalophilus]MEA1053366.1 hypothetical protein [Lamprobacter modestohalophilus]